jgi:predicted kinase
VLSRSGDLEGALLLRSYAVYRCLVRAKVAAIRMGQQHADPGEVLADITLAERLIAPHPLQLTLTHGLSGCGKTFLTDQWLQSDAQPPSLRLRADVERKHLFGLAGTARTASGLNEGLYTPQAHDLTYAHLRDEASQLLRAGWSVIVDAAFLKRADRDSFRVLAAEQGVALAILAPHAEPDQLRQRILARNAAATDASEATLEVLAQQMQELEPLAADEGGVMSVPGMADLQPADALHLA